MKQETTEKTKRIPLGTNVISVRDGMKYVYLKRLNKNVHRAVEAEAFKQACSVLQEEAKKNPLAVKGSPMAYVAKNQIKQFPKDELITETQYTETINTPENKPVIAELKKLESRYEKLTADIEQTRTEMNTLNKKLFTSIKR